MCGFTSLRHDPSLLTFSMSPAARSMSTSWRRFRADMLCCSSSSCSSSVWCSPSSSARSISSCRQTPPLSLTSITPIIAHVNYPHYRSQQPLLLVELNLRSGMRSGRPGDFQRTRLKSGGCARIEKTIDHRGYRLYSIWNFCRLPIGYFHHVIGDSPGASPIVNWVRPLSAAPTAIFTQQLHRNYE